jgi:hypothetical protein
MSTSRCDPHKIHADAATYCIHAACISVQRLLVINKIWNAMCIKMRGQRAYFSFFLTKDARELLGIYNWGQLFGRDSIGRLCLNDGLLEQIPSHAGSCKGSVKCCSTLFYTVPNIFNYIISTNRRFSAKILMWLWIHGS